MPVTDYAMQNAGSLGIKTDRLQKLDNLLGSFIEKDLRQTIVTKITRKGAPIFEGCYGTNTKPYGVKQDTIFPVASITKPVVSALLLCLQEDGLIDMCDPVCRYLPEFNEGGRERIQLWYLVTHTSGLLDENAWGNTHEHALKEFRMLPPEDDAGPEEWTRFHKELANKMGLDPDAPQSDRMNNPGYVLSLKQPVNHEPRTIMRYCNYGCQLLKWVVDAVTGEPIDSFAQKRLFNPLGMSDTYWRVPEDKFDRILGRGDRCEGAPFINSKDYYQSESGSGGLKTTVGDITRFGQMVLGKGTLDGAYILNRRSILEMTRNHNSDIETGSANTYAAWGLGWNIRQGKKDDTGLLRSANCLDHGGWAGTKFVVDPDEDITAAIFTAEYKHSEMNFPNGIYGMILNVLYSSLD